MKKTKKRWMELLEDVPAIGEKGLQIHYPAEAARALAATGRVKLLKSGPTKEAVEAAAEEAAEEEEGLDEPKTVAELVAKALETGLKDDQVPALEAIGKDPSEFSNRDARHAELEAWVDG